VGYCDEVAATNVRVNDVANVHTLRWLAGNAGGDGGASPGDFKYINIGVSLHLLHLIPSTAQADVMGAVRLIPPIRQRVLDFVLATWPLSSTDGAEEQRGGEEEDNEEEEGGRHAPFLCVHWRTGDFADEGGGCFKDRSCYQPPEYVGARLQAVGAALNLTRVFVATDANTEAVQKLRMELGGMQVTTYSTSSDIGGVAIRPSLHAPLEEQGICALAHTAVLNRRSTFSERIRLLRKSAGADATDLWW
jgi:hypothetical protein